MAVHKFIHSIPIKMEKKKIILIATASIAVGTVAALLITPKRAKQIRRKLMDIASQKIDVMLQKVENRLENAYERAIQIQQAQG